MLNIFHLSFLEKSTYFEIQKRYLYLALHKVYRQFRNRIIDNLVSSGEPVGDRRCDSPGYSAKYGTYTLAYTKSGEIIDFYVTV